MTVNGTLVTRTSVRNPARLACHHSIAILVTSLLCTGCMRSAALSGVACPEPTDQLGHPDSVLFWTPPQQLASFRSYRCIFSTRTIPASHHPLRLPERPRDLNHLRYQVDGDTFDLEDFKQHNHVLGLLVLDHGAIVLEQYAGGNTRDTRWVSYSVAKSVVSMLMGAALQDGYIDSVEQPVTDYVPSLRGTSYQGVTIRDALQMASGVEWNEDYADPESDVSNEIGLTSLERLEYLGNQPRVAPAGTLFNYNTGETHLVGAVIRGAIGNNLSTYLAAKIWEPFGMEADADWMLVEPHGAEHGGCCISATLRDYARIGLFALRGGVLPDGRRILPSEWMQQSTAPSQSDPRYGYLWWLRDNGAYTALGIFGQAIWISPADSVVIVTHSAWPRATGPEFSAHRNAFFTALTSAMR